MFSLLRSTLFLATLLATPFIRHVEGVSTVGCINTSNGALTGHTDLAVRVTDLTSCQNTCAQGGFTYAYFSVSLATGNNCQCGNDNNFVSANAFVSPSIASTCVGTNLAVVVNVRSAFQQTGCLSVGSLTGGLIGTLTGGLLGATVNNPGACFSRCTLAATVYVIPYNLLGITPTYGCVCGGPGGSVDNNALVQCGLGTYQRFTRSAAAVASGLTRRKRQVEVTSEQTRRNQVLKRKWDCPRGMTACNVSGIKDAWECVDPASDLESCGGCTFGNYVAQTVFSANETAIATGIDCTSLPGLLRGRVTCTSGRCEAFACKRGWTLIGGDCIKT
ncbi:hypothetical protein IAR55_005722 [Kwoniella newhampshirensis]|uniref:Protein CPL1-like domain-containing protein n=1 Tax=Kwoniella newhampshirensis TaxID=1651941 RepID=A0AAW0YG25_9TREE